ncbi:restriction endonuclease subunit S, partial [Anaerosalibacter bizertensis]|nr:restriction endonuclease subunit S [Anaerosalibacter bizertensis]
MTRAMKDSGIDWIGEIPEGWKIQNLKSILRERNELNNPVKTDFVLSLTNDRGVIPYSEKGDIGNKAKEDLTKYKLVYPNDIVVNSMNVIIGSVGLSKYFGVVSPVYYMLYVRKEEDSIYYYNYLFQTKELQIKLKGYGNGIMEHRLRIPMINLNKVHLPYPPQFQQKAIADFLDKKVSEIDNIISKTKKVIEEYKK